MMTTTMGKRSTNASSSSVAFGGGCRRRQLLPSAAATTDVAADVSDDMDDDAWMNGVELDDFETFVLDMQTRVCGDMEALDGGGRAFSRDAWVREGKGSGFGITRVLEGGDLFEKAAANVSVIRGVLTPERARAMSSRQGSNNTTQPRENKTRYDFQPESTRATNLLRLGQLGFKTVHAL